VCAGLVLGLICALASAKLVGKFLVVSGSDPLMYFTVSAALTLVALVACYRRGGLPGWIPLWLCATSSNKSIGLESGGEGWTTLPKPRLWRRRRSLLAHSLSAFRAYPEPWGPTRLPAQIHRLLALPGNNIAINN